MACVSGLGLGFVAAGHLPPQNTLQPSIRRLRRFYTDPIDFNQSVVLLARPIVVL
jgi:hypothetical protein